MLSRMAIECLSIGALSEATKLTIIFLHPNQSTLHYRNEINEKKVVSIRSRKYFSLHFLYIYSNILIYFFLITHWLYFLSIFASNITINQKVLLQLVSNSSALLVCNSVTLAESLCQRLNARILLTLAINQSLDSTTNTLFGQLSDAFKSKSKSIRMAKQVRPSIALLAVPMSTTIESSIDPFANHFDMEINSFQLRDTWFRFQNISLSNLA